MPLYRITLNASYANCTIQNVVHFVDKTSQGGQPVVPQVIAQDVADNWLPLERPIHQLGFRWSSVTCSEIRNPNPMPAAIVAVNIPGTGITESHSVSALKLRWITNRGGRRGFGKYYIGGFNWALIEGNNNISQFGRDSLLGLCAGLEVRYMQNDGGPVPFQMILVHKDVNDPPNPIVNVDFYAVMGVQRRRNKFVGI